MKTAPKDGTFIQIAYLSFSDNEEIYVGHGRWVDVPHWAEVQRYLNAGNPPPDFPLPYEPHWEVAYVAILDCGGRWN